MIEVIVRNYRGFSEADPLRIEVGTGLTALVGRNNSGKSSAKLFFYEFRPLFEHFFETSQILNVMRGGRVAFSYQGISDPEEIFNNQNNRPITVEFKIPHKDLKDDRDRLFRIVGSCDRGVPTNWNFLAYGQKSPNEISDPSAAQVGIGNASVAGRRVETSDFESAMRVLRDARYYGPFRNAINQGAGQYFDLRVGTSFIDLWNEWKTAGVKQKSRAISQITDEIRRLFDFKTLEISSSDLLKTLIVSVDGQSYRLNELGSGLAQFILVMGNAAANPPSILLIDEPETNLHPALQIDFLLALAKYATQGVIFSTHSIGLARSVAEKIYSIQKRTGVPSYGHLKPPKITPNLSAS